MGEKTERIIILFSGGIVIVTLLITLLMQAYRVIYKEEKKTNKIEDYFLLPRDEHSIIEKNYLKIGEDTINISPIKDSHFFTIGLIYKENSFKYAFLTEEKEDYYMIDVDSTTIERNEDKPYYIFYNEEYLLNLPKNTKIERIEENYLKQITKNTKEKNIIKKINNYKSETN